VDFAARLAATTIVDSRYSSRYVGSTIYQEAVEMSSSYALHATLVIDAVSPEPLRDGVVLVEDGTITDIGPADRVSVPNDAVRIELGERTLLPGMMDVHVHLSGSRSYNEAATPQDLLVLRAAEDCCRLIDAGFTTVRDVGSMIALSLRRAIADGVITGPRIYAAGPIISQTGGHGDAHHLPLEEARRRRNAIIADGPDQCRQAVRQAVRAGADLIKICTTGGVGSMMDDPEDEHFTAEEIAAIVDEAHRARRRVASHAQGKAGILAAVRGGVDSIEHGYYLDEECAAEMRERGTHFVPTLALVEVYKRAVANPHDMPPWRLRKQQAAIPAIEREFPLACRSGLTVATGSDYSGSPLRRHGDNADEPITMVQHGLAPLEAIRAATIQSARIIGVENSVGSLEPGKQADLIALDGDPLTDINALRRVAFVMQAGRVHRAAETPARAAVPA
jgi:imidazolonepropionase-like amidohydrolase